MIECQVTNCYLHKDCFFKTVFVRNPDPKTGCSYFRKLKNEKTTITYDDNGNKKRKTRADKGQKRDKKAKKRKMESNLLQDIL